jgi:hypothetical protein
MRPLSDYASDDEIAAQYTAWIAQFGGTFRQKWEHQLTADRDAALCEARTWEMLSAVGVDLAPNDDIAAGKPAPDFKCTRDGHKFYAEVTCLATDRISREIGLAHPFQPHCGAGPGFGALTQAIFEKCQHKASQCAAANDAPCLLVVGTFHTAATLLCINKSNISELLTGKQMILSSSEEIRLTNADLTET